MSNLTFTFTLTKPPDPFEEITYEGPEDYIIKVIYRALSLGSCPISSIHIIKPLKKEDYYTAYGNSGKNIEFTKHSLSLQIGCGRFLSLRQALGETITIKFTNMRETIGPTKELRFDTYTISTKDRHEMYTNINFGKHYVNTIDSADCKTALIGAPPPRAVLPPLPPLSPPPPPPSPNTFDKKDKIEKKLEGTGLLVGIAPGKSDTIQISNKGSHLVAHVKGKEITYPFALSTERLTADQEKEILGLLEGGRRKPKRKTNKRRRRTNRV